MKIRGDLYLIVEDYHIGICEDTIEKLFEDKQILQKLIKLDIEAKREVLAKMKKYVKTVLKEREKYSGPDEYPAELVGLIREIDEEIIKDIEELEDDIRILEELISGQVTV